MNAVGPITRPETLKELAYKEIRSLLTSGKIESSKIITAAQFAAILEVSRTPVREALLQLASEGFLVAIDGRGFMIKEFSEKEIRDFFETRRIIEAYVAQQLVSGLTEVDLLQMERTLEIMKELADEGDPFAFLDADRDFHMGLVQRHNNLFLISIVDQIRTLISILGRRALFMRGRTRQVIREHASIIEAFSERDVKKAVEAVTQHLIITEREILQHLKA